MPESPPGRIQRQILTRPHGRARDVTRPVHQYAGAGTAKNPKRPQYSDLAGLTGFTAELSDDGRFALVEFVAKESKFLTPYPTPANVWNAKTPSIKTPS